MENIIIGIKTVFWYIFVLGLSFLLGTFFIVGFISSSFGDYNIFRNMLDVFKPQKEINRENAERNHALKDIFEKVKSSNNP